jgi:hypothetical protein
MAHRSRRIRPSSKRPLPSLFMCPLDAKAFPASIPFPGPIRVRRSGIHTELQHHCPEQLYAGKGILGRRTSDPAHVFFT